MTILYLGWMGYHFGSDVWELTQTDRMGEAGDFLAGFTTPEVFLWLIYGYHLQCKELILQRKELRQVGERLAEQTGVMRAQANVEEERWEHERFFGCGVWPILVYILHELSIELYRL